MLQLLAAVDGSKHSKQIVEFSCDLAEKLVLSIILIYVSPYPDLINEYMEIGGRSPSAEALQYVKRAEEVTSELVELVHARGIPCEVILDTGDPAQKIVEKAIEKKVQLITLGLKGLHGVDKIRSLGSVARRVLETSLIPVVVVTGGSP